MSIFKQRKMNKNQNKTCFE